MILNTIIQNYQRSKFQRYETNRDILNSFYIGSYGPSVTPKFFFNNGDTYITGTDNSPNRNPIIYRYRQSDNSVVGVDVGTIDNFDPLYHQHPAVICVNNFVYVFMVNGHGQDIKIWKSNTTEIEDGFTLHHTISGNFGYLSIYRCDNNSIYFCTRGTNSSPQYGHIVGRSNGTDYTSWTWYYITDPQFNTTKNRHYKNIPTPYGNNTWFYFGISMRNEVPIEQMYFVQGYYKTRDFRNFYSLDETFTWDASTTTLNPTQVQNELTYVGNISDTTKYVGPSSACIIDDVVYGHYLDTNIGYYKLYKIVNGIKTDYDCFIPNLTTAVNASQAISFFYNQNNLVLIAGGKIWTCDLNYENYNEVFNLIDGSLQYQPTNTLIPYNLDDVFGNYMFGGTTIVTGIFPYWISNDKWVR